MKIVINETNTETSLVSDVTQDKCYVYINPAGGVWILSKLGRYVVNTIQDHDKLARGRYHYGFLRMDRINEVPVFTTATMRETVEKALNSGRKVLEFDSFGDFMKWKLKIE